MLAQGYTLQDIKKIMHEKLPTTYKLSAEQLKTYEEEGYLVIRGLIDPILLELYRDRYLKIARGEVPRSYMTLVNEECLKDKDIPREDKLNKIDDILCDEYLLVGYAENPRLLDVVTQLIGDQLSALYGIYINKPAGSTRHPTHQDHYYIPIYPADQVLGTWTAIDRATVENGCFFVIPGTHKLPVYAHGNLPDSNKMYHGILDQSVIPVDRVVPLLMEPGDALFFHPKLIHGSYANITQKHRNAIACHYIGKDHYFIEKTKDTIHDNINVEVLQETKRRGFDDIGIIEYLQLKIRKLRTPKL